jgi:hypothetical protein
VIERDEFNVYRDVDREAAHDYDPEPEEREERPSWHEARADDELAVVPARTRRCPRCGWTRIIGTCDGRCLT